MRSDDKPVAVLCADIHLSMNPPVARRSEPDWFQAMGRTLKQLKDLADLLDVPIICAGDVFDRWNSPPELVNFALRNLPKMYAVPGQHDLPLHRMDLIHKSAFDTLVLAKVIKVLRPEGTQFRGFHAHGFGWGDVLKSPEQMGEGISLAVVHAFIWTEDYGYPGVSDDSNLRQFKKKLRGYTAAVFGDNHKGFQAGSILNCGTFFRRKSDEIDYHPSIGVLYESGKIERNELDISGEYMECVTSETSCQDGDFKGFLDELSRLTSDPLSFVDVMERAMNSCGDGVRRVLKEVMA